MVGASQTSRHWLLVIMTSLTLMACGGGGSRSPSDTLPNDFEPAASLTGVVIGTDVTFPAFNVAGIDAEVPITIVGGLYSIGDSAATASAGTVSNGDTVTVQVAASDMFSTETRATLTIGSGTGTFTVESEAEDADPDAFELGDAVTVNTAEAQAESTAFTVSGINSSASISISNGEYRIGESGPYTSEAGTVALGESVQVRVTASSTAPADQTATLTIGDQSDTFTVSTADNSAPTAQVIFPTPTTMTDGTSVTLRGIASDDFGPIASIRVTVTTDDGATQVGTDTVDATDTDDFSDTWSINVDLGAEKLNTINVEAIDAAGNIQSEPVVITMLQAADALQTNFPVGNEIHIGEIRSRGAVLDKANSRMLILSSISSPGDIIAVDVSSGDRTVFYENNSDMDSASAMHLLPSTNEIVVSDINGAAIFRSPLDSPALTLLTDASFDDVTVPLDFPNGLRFDVTSGLLMVVDRENQIFSVDPTNGTRARVSSNISNDNEPLFLSPLDLVINDTDRTLLVTDSNAFEESEVGTVLQVNIADGSRSNVVVQDGADFGRPYGIDWLVQDNVALVSSRSTEGRREPGRILTLDLTQNMLTTLAANDFPDGAANDIQVPQFLSVDQESELAYIIINEGDARENPAVIVLDSTTGERVVLTRSVR